MEGDVVTEPRIVRGEPVDMQPAVLELLPETGSVEVQRDTPARTHELHTHPTPETLLVIDGSITFRWDGAETECRSGDRLLLPAEAVHGSTAGPDGCLYVIATEIKE